MADEDSKTKTELSTARLAVFGSLGAAAIAGIVAIVVAIIQSSSGGTEPGEEKAEQALVSITQWSEGDLSTDGSTEQIFFMGNVSNLAGNEAVVMLKEVTPRGGETVRYQSEPVLPDDEGKWTVTWSTPRVAGAKQSYYAVVASSEAYVRKVVVEQPELTPTGSTDPGDTVGETPTTVTPEPTGAAGAPPPEVFRSPLEESGVEADGVAGFSEELEIGP